MNHDRLRIDLADLAEEVTPVDLRDRALRTSRRLGIQRAIATSAAVVVMLGAATGTAFALIPRAGGPAPTPAGPSETASWPPVEVTPTPSVSPTGTAEAPSTATIGTLVYGPKSMGDGSSPTARLYSWQPGTKGDPTGLLLLSREAAMLNAAVSADGERIAWVDRDGALWLADTDGTDKRKVRDGVDPMCWGPTWSPDGKQLALALTDEDQPGESQRGLLDVASNSFTPVDKLDGCHPLWAANGSAFAFSDGSTGRVTMTSPSGAGQWSIPNLGGAARYDSFDVASLSPDGSRIALYRRGQDQEAGDVARELDVNAVLNTGSGQPVALDLGGRELRQAYFQADGTLVARVESDGGFALVLLDAEGKKISETPEPAALKDMQILAVTG